MPHVIRSRIDFVILLFVYSNFICSFLSHNFWSLFASLIRSLVIDFVYILFFPFRSFVAIVVKGTFPLNFLRFPKIMRICFAIYLWQMRDGEWRFRGACNILVNEKIKWMYHSLLWVSPGWIFWLNRVVSMYYPLHERVNVLEVVALTI